MKKTNADLIRAALYEPAGIPFKVATSVKRGGKNVRRCEAKRFCQWSIYQCPNAASVQRGKNMFCRVCDPIAKAAKREAKERAWEAKRAERDAATARHERIEEAERAVIDAAKAVNWTLQAGSLAPLRDAVNNLIEAEK